jgi:hypothetical protein
MNSKEHRILIGRINMDRRAFLKIPLGGVMAAMAAPLLAPGQAVASSFSKGMLLKGQAADLARQTLGRLGSREGFVEAGRRLVLKSSLRFADFQNGAAPGQLELMRETLLLCQEAGAEHVLILDDFFRKLGEAPPHYNAMIVCDGDHKGACQNLRDRARGIYRDLRGDEWLMVMEGAKRLPRVREAEEALTVRSARRGGGKPLVALEGMYQAGLNYELGLRYQEQNQRPMAVDLYSSHGRRATFTLTDIGHTLFIKGADGRGLLLHPAYFCPGQG